MDVGAEIHEEETLGKVYDSRLMGRLLAYLRPYRLQASLAVFLIILSSLLQLIAPLATAIALDLYIRPDAAAVEESLDPEVEAARSGVSTWFADTAAALGFDLTPEEGIAVIALAVLLAQALTFGILYLQAYVMQMMGQHIMFDLRQEVFEHFQRLPISYFDKNPIGRLVTRVTTDIDALNELFTAGLVSIFGDIFLLLGIVAVLFALNWRLALVTFAILPLLLALTFWFKTRARVTYREVRIRIAKINAFLQEHITGMQVLQLFGREEPALGRFRKINKDHRDANIRVIFYYAIYFPAVELITALGIGLIIWYGGGRVMAGFLSLGALIAFIQYAQRFYQPLADLSDKYNILQAAMAASERTFQVLDTPVDIETPADPWAPERIEGSIALEHVDFAYKEGEPVLHDVSFRVEPGETLAIVGHTGAGKSTLANLLLRFYDVGSGSVEVDGVDVRRWDLRSLRQGIGLVLQDVFLFSGSVARNIRLDEERISDEAVRRAAREVQALDFIERLPGGFEAALKERGAGLSVGQKQLLAFARALAFDPRILILDEATSSIDTETEQHIQRALDRLLVGRTSLVIAHRLSTIQKADRVLVLHKGRVRELGTHQELLEQRGIYYRLYQLQLKDQQQGQQGGEPEPLPAGGSPALSGA